MPNDEDPRATLRLEADRLLGQIRRSPDDAGLDAARKLLKQLKATREFGLMAKTAEAISRLAPEDTTTQSADALRLFLIGTENTSASAPIGKGNNVADLFELVIPMLTAVSNSARSSGDARMSQRGGTQ